MAVEIKINGADALETLKELSGLTALLGNGTTTAAPAALAAQEPTKQEEAPKSDKPKSAGRSKPKAEETPPAQEPEDPTPAQEPDLEPEQNQPSEDAPTYTVEQVRAKLGALAKVGKSAAVKQLITDMGADNITTMDPAKYPEVMKRAAEIEAEGE